MTFILSQNPKYTTLICDSKCLSDNKAAYTKPTTDVPNNTGVNQNLYFIPKINSRELHFVLKVLQIYFTMFLSIDCHAYI